MTSTHEADELFDAAAAGPLVHVPAGWGQGRAVYGGLVGGVLTAHLLGVLDLDPDTLRAATTSFVAPLEPGPARLEATVLRRGSSATHAQARIWQTDPRDGAETLRAVQLGAFGAERGSRVQIEPPPLHELPDPGGIDPVPWHPELGADFIAHIELRFASGLPPYSGAATGDQSGYMRFRRPPAGFGLPHFVALVDSWPPAPVQCLPAPARFSTLTWTLEIVATPHGTPESQWWYDVTTDAAYRGYGHSHATIRSAAGQLVAISRQTISLFG